MPLATYRHSDRTDPPFEFSRIDDGVFIGTNACCRNHFAQGLLAEGVSGDISLEDELIDQPFGIRTYLWLPTKDKTPPSMENLRTGTSALREMLANGQKVYIHCRNGHGRGPTFYAAFLMTARGLSADEAVARIAAKRPTIHPEESQLEFLRKLEK